MHIQKILLVGCGKMGGALLGGLINSGVLSRNVMVVEPNIASVHDRYNVRVLKEFDETEFEDFMPDIILLAVKPQIVSKVLCDYKKFVGQSLFVSIIAGKTVSFFEQHLGKDAAIIRTMPNLPMMIGKGAVAWYKNKAVSDEQLAILGHLFASAGVLQQVEKEEMLDAVTAISGSGPAYAFYFMELMVEAAVKLGLHQEVARDLVLQTVAGSAELAINSDKNLTELREAVTSPKGTTEAALEQLMSDDILREIITKTTNAACRRSKELSE